MNRLATERAACLGDCRQRIDHHAARSMLANQRPELDQVILGCDRFSAPRIHPQYSALQVRLELDSDRGEILYDPIGAFVEAHEQCALPAPARSLCELSRQSRFGCTGHPGDQRAAAAEQSTTQHRVEPVEADGDSLARSHLPDFGRFGAGDFHPRPTKTHGKFTPDKRRAAIFGDLDPVQRNPVLQTRVELDHAVHHELQETIVGHLRAAIVDLGRENGGIHLVFRQPIADTVDLPDFRLRIPQQRQQYIDAVKHDPPRAHFLFLCLEHGQHAAQIEFSGLDDIGRQVRVHEKQFFLEERRQIPLEPGGIGDYLVWAFLERDEDSGLPTFTRRANQGLNREHRLSRARSALQQTDAAARQPTEAQRVKTRDARFDLGWIQGNAL
jgi:hypothetical protein